MQIEGIDTTTGLARLNGNLALYLKLLKSFASRGQQLVPELQELIRSSQIEDAERMIHTLKGSAGNLGAAGIQVLAASLEQLIRDRQYDRLADPLNTLSDELVRVSAAIFQISARTDELSTPIDGSFPGGSAG